MLERKEQWRTVAILAIVASLGEAQSTICRSSTTISIPAATRILQAASTCASPGLSSAPTGAYTTIYQTTYLEFCPTGLQPKTYTVTESCSAGQSTARPAGYVPQGFTTTVTECHVCGNTPITATLTIPCSSCTHSGHAQPTLPSDSGNTNPIPGHDSSSTTQGASPPNEAGIPHAGGTPGAGDSQCTGGDCAQPSANAEGGAGTSPGASSPPSPVIGGVTTEQQTPTASTHSQAQPECSGPGCHSTGSSTGSPAHFTGSASKQPTRGVTSVLAVLTLIFSTLICG
ncbi:hypothetical protein AMS68_002031 [Peltaster fructicola]|uniref:Uncharacterized protein n=1 Tax=Peltaster fructicola TaxID=286661 RepID=A0A6H0XP63_9PEZI|nr:hypothetical protein AMS68_002031 [Peltaster fructicola]